MASERGARASRVAERLETQDGSARVIECVLARQSAGARHGARRIARHSGMYNAFLMNGSDHPIIYSIKPHRIKPTDPLHSGKSPALPPP